MLHKLPTNVYKVCGCTKLLKRQSALFVNGAKATEAFTYVTPHIDFSDQIKLRDRIQEQLNKRKSKLDLNKVEGLWAVYEELRQCKADLDKQKEAISKELGKLIKSGIDNENINKLKIQINLVKDNIKKLKVPLWSAEEAAIVEVLKLPNALHPLTPDGANKILYTHLMPPNNNKDHLKIGQEQNIINFKKNENYYLTGEAAICELGAKFYFSDILKKNKFIQFSNPDFVKSMIIEGCGEDHTNPDATFILHHNEESKVNIDSRMHLTGGASLSSFFAYHTKNVLYPKVFPLKYFTMGRQYVPALSDEDSLFHVSQSSVVQVFGATKNKNDLDELLQQLIDTLKHAYNDIGYHFRLSIVSADKLSMWESLRVVVEMYASSIKRYIEVANISVSGDFISKRLLFTYVENKESKFPYIISGTVLNIPRFLGCVLEQDGDFKVPEMFKVENWTLK